MAKLNCSKVEEYPSSDGTRCCDRCAPGQYKQAECDSTKRTVCAKCEDRFYTNTKNHLPKCQPCTSCNSNNKQKEFKKCTAQEDTVCECVAGFYCTDDQCTHCLGLTKCHVGKGVKVQATRTKDTVCAPCVNGTYSNVADDHSPCRIHTRCEDFGRVLMTPGTPTTDAICGDFKSQCPWILPASLWSGLVLTALILLGIICWRAKRKSYKAARSSLPITLVEMVPAAQITQLELPLPFTELNSHCQESCAVEGCKLPLFTQDDNVVSCGTQDSIDSVDSSHPITPLKASVSFVESSQTNGSVGYCTANFLRTYSEPQEDEYCGT